MSEENNELSEHVYYIIIIYRILSYVAILLVGFVILFRWHNFEHNKSRVYFRTLLQAGQVSNIKV